MEEKKLLKDSELLTQDLNNRVRETTINESYDSWLGVHKSKYTYGQYVTKMRKLENSFLGGICKAIKKNIKGRMIKETVVVCDKICINLLISMKNPTLVHLWMDGLAHVSKFKLKVVILEKLSFRNKQFWRVLGLLIH
jgi:hypothetical protein